MGYGSPTLPGALPPGRHFGTPARVLTLGPFTLTETTYAAGYRTPWHAHERSALCLVLSGHYRERFHHREIDCPRGAVVVRGPGEEHADHVGAAGARCFIIEPEPAWLSRAGPEAPTATYPESAGPVGWLMSQALEEFRRPDDLSRVMLEGLVLTVMAGACRARRPEHRLRPVWWRRVQEYLEERYKERITLQELGLVAGVHPVHLATTFRERTGQTVGGWIRARRIRAAQEMLRDGTRPIGAIGCDLGFSNPSHFSRTFRRLAGTTPQEWRRRRALD